MWKEPLKIAILTFYYVKHHFSGANLTAQRAWNNCFLIPYIFSCAKVNILVPNSMCRAVGTGWAQGHLPTQYFELLVYVPTNFIVIIWTLLSVCPPNIWNLPTALVPHVNRISQIYLSSFSVSHLAKFSFRTSINYNWNIERLGSTHFVGMS